MKIRVRSLPAGWYPQTSGETQYTIEKFQSLSQENQGRALSGVLPHAGWYFSGQLASEVVMNLNKQTETICVVGGHLPPGNQVLAAFDHEFETPLGNLENDFDLLDSLKSKISLIEDDFQDNTVEIQLPLIKFFFPQAKILWLRVSPSSIAIELGELLAELAQNRSLTVLGSTDLTHYGPNYGYAPKGKGPEALSWVKEKNDKEVIDFLLKFDLHKALDHANENRSACSAGGAVCAASFAKRKGVTQGRLLKYANSYDIQASSSFVGYVSLLYEE